MTDQTSLGHWVRRFLLDYAASERNLSPNTRTSYRAHAGPAPPFVAKSKARPSTVGGDDLSARCASLPRSTRMSGIAR